MSVTLDAPSPLPALSLPRIRDPEVHRLLEGVALAGASATGVVGLSLVAGELQAPLLTVGAVGHLAVASVLTGTAFVRHVRKESQPLILGLLAALTALGLLTSATHLAPV